MQVRRDYYEVLGLRHNATSEDIRKAFRRLAFQYHPDRNRDADAAQRFKEINEAYQCLCDPDRRRSYDLFGRRGGTAPGAGFEDFGFGGLGEIFETFFGSAFGDSSRRAPAHGESFHLKTTLSFEEAARGCIREFTVRRTEVCASCHGTGCAPGTSPLECPDCGGRGRVRRVEQSIFGRFSHVVRCTRCNGTGNVIASLCPFCRGKGETTATRTLRVDMPAGIEAGSRITLRSQGSIGSNGGSPGDVIVTVDVEPHLLFTREGLHIHHEVPVNFAQAALGAQMEVPVLGGTARIRLPANTQSGDVVRLKGKGIQQAGGRKRGDHLVHVKVVTPKKLNREQRRLFEELAKTLPSE